MAEHDDWSPFNEIESAVQIEAVLDLCATRGVTRVADLGAGSGRVAIPLAEAGVRVLAVDSSEAALDALRTNVRETNVGGLIEPVRLDVLTGVGSLRFADGERPQAALLLGHTLLEFHDVERAAGLFRALRSMLGDGGLVVVDQFVHDIWADVAEGAWQEGVSEDGGWQMIWTPGDEIVVMRRGEDVDADDWNVREGDRLLRLWSLGSLRLLGLASGWSGPCEDRSGALLLFGTT